MSGYLDKLDDASLAVWHQGIKILQGFRLADDDPGHVRALLDHLAPLLGPGAKRILDIGSGFGEVARLMREQRPELDFVLVNLNQLQLGYTPPDLNRVRADLHVLPFADDSFDAVMFLYTLCHADYAHALYEARRVTKPGGVLFVFDYARLRGDNRLMAEKLFAHAFPMDEIIDYAEGAGWIFTGGTIPGGSDATFRRIYVDQSEYSEIFSDLVPVIWGAVRPE